MTDSTYGYSFLGALGLTLTFDWYITKSGKKGVRKSWMRI
jgi:hypothetical protein